MGSDPKLTTPLHSGLEVKRVLKRIRHILDQARDPYYWSGANQGEPAKVECWLKSVRFAAASKVAELPELHSWRRTPRPVWLWMPLRPVHDRIQVTHRMLNSYLTTTTLERHAVVERARLALLKHEVTNEETDLVDKVWRALRRIDQLEIVHWTNAPRLEHISSLAFPFWTSVFPYEMDWRPNWCNLCGFPVKPYPKGDILWQGKVICLPCAQYHGAAVFLNYQGRSDRFIPSELNPERWGWHLCELSTRLKKYCCRQYAMGGWLRGWEIPKEHEDAD